jgi:hypothetical protein
MSFRDLTTPTDVWFILMDFDGVMSENFTVLFFLIAPTSELRFLLGSIGV